MRRAPLSVSVDYAPLLFEALRLDLLVVSDGALRNRDPSLPRYNRSSRMISILSSKGCGRLKLFAVHTNMRSERSRSEFEICPESLESFQDRALPATAEAGSPRKSLPELVDSSSKNSGIAGARHLLEVGHDLARLSNRY